MKKQLLLICITTMLFSENVNSQTNNILRDKIKSATQKKGEVYQNKALVSRPAKSNNFEWDDVSNSWLNVDSTYYTYDSDGFETLLLNRMNGEYRGKRQISYNVNHLITEDLYQYYNPDISSFVNSSRSRTEYDQNNNATLRVYESWNMNSQTWEITFGEKFNYTYDNSNKLIEKIAQQFNSTTYQYENSWKYINTYSDNNLVEEEWFDWNGSTWIREYKYLYEYANNIATSMTYQEWDGSQYENLYKLLDFNWRSWNTSLDDSEYYSYIGQGWENSNWLTFWRTTKTYDVNGGYIELDEMLENGNWSDDYRITRTYDNNSNPTIYKEESYNNNAWELEYYSEQAYTYDANNHITQTIWKNLNYNTNQINNSLRKDYSDHQMYNNTVGIEAITLNSELYPNPVKDVLRISSDTHEIKQLNIIDLNGKIHLQHQVIGNKTELNIASLQSGIYLVEIFTEGPSTIKRFIKE